MTRKKLSVSHAKLLKVYIFLLCLVSVAVSGQGNHGELRLQVTDPSGRGVKTTIHLLSEANQYRADLETDKQGNVDVARLPYGIYQLQVDQAGFASIR